jgi:flagellar protein FlbT
MGLKIELKPHERFILGGAVVRNGGSRTELIIENNVPLLRGKNILSLEEADTPCKRIFFSVQLMYLGGGDMKEYYRTYWSLVRDVVEAAPSTVGLIDAISEHIIEGRYYPALKAARELIDYEERLVNHVRKSTAGVSADTENGDDGPGD